MAIKYKNTLIKDEKGNRVIATDTPEGRQTRPATEEDISRVKNRERINVGGQELTRQEFQERRKEAQADRIQRTQFAVNSVLGLEGSGSEITNAAPQDLPVNVDLGVQGGLRGFFSNQTDDALEQFGVTANLRKKIDAKTKAKIDAINFSDATGEEKIKNIIFQKTKRGIYTDLLEVVDRSAILLSELSSKLPAGLGDFASVILGNNKEQLNNIKSSLDKRKEISSQIAANVENGIITPEEGLEALRIHEERLSQDAQAAQYAIITSPSIRTSSVVTDLETTLLQQLQSNFQARNRILVLGANPELIKPVDLGSLDQSIERLGDLQ